MVRKSLLVVALVAIAMPASAQEEHVWTGVRPDGIAPLGVTDSRTLRLGELELSYRFSQLNFKGVWFANDSITLDETLDFYQVAPLTLTNQTHRVGLAFALSNALTLSGHWSISKIQREQLTNTGVFYVTEVRALGDLEAAALYSVFDEESPYRAHVHLGARIPLGESNALTWGPFGSFWAPYDQRTSGGTFAVLPGLTIQAQNEVASVGLQVKGDISLGTNGQGYALGNRFEANGWAAYRINRYFSASARLHWQNWGGIRGADPRLDPIFDPGNDGFSMEGERVDLPLGLNLYMPEGRRFAGHRVSLEGIFPVHHQYEGPQLGADWGVMVGWQAPVNISLPSLPSLPGLRRGGNEAPEEGPARDVPVVRAEPIEPEEEMAQEGGMAQMESATFRPDAVAPVGVTNGGAPRPGALELSYRFSQVKSKGVWVGSDSIGVAAALLAYQEAPLTLTNQTHWIGLALAPIARFTLSADWSVSKIRRVQRTGAGVTYSTEVRALGDVEVTGRVSIFGEEKPYQAYVHVGGRIPVANPNNVVWTPSGSTWAPYDMRVGGGTYAVIPGITVQARSSFGSMGAQFKGDISRGSNDLGYAPGVRLEGTAWAAFRVNDFVSLSGRVKWQRAWALRGADGRLDRLADPGNHPASPAGIRVDVPVGLNIYMPQGKAFAGHRLSVEAFIPVIHDYAAPQLGAHWGIPAGWHAPLSLGAAF